MDDFSVDGAPSSRLLQSRDAVAAMHRALQALERLLRAGPEPLDVHDHTVASLLRRMYHAAHSAKGLMAGLALPHMVDLVHAVESVLDSIQMGHVWLDSDSIAQLFSALDLMDEWVQEPHHAAIKTTPRHEHAEAVIQRLQRCAEGESAHKKFDSSWSVDGLSNSVLQTLTQYEQGRFRTCIAAGQRVYLLHVQLPLPRAVAMLSELETTLQLVGEVLSKIPHAMPDQSDLITFDVIVASHLELPALRRSLADMGIDAIKPLHGRLGGQRRGRGAKSVASSARAEHTMNRAPLLQEAQASTIRIDTRRIDSLLYGIDAIAASQNALHKIAIDGPSTPSNILLQNTVSTLATQIDTLKQDILHARVVPVGVLFDHVIHHGRNVAKALGRDVHFDVQGDDTPVDRLLIDQLATPLLHLMRNAIDHGIESAEERRIFCKTVHGCVTLMATAAGGRLVLAMRDDGRGIDVESIRRKVISQGTLDRDAAWALGRRALFACLLQPGFSTRTQVSQTSGRGIGLDVVHMHVKRMGGEMGIESTEAKGTTITLAVPITLGEIKITLITVGTSTYGIPSADIVRHVPLAQQDLRKVGSHWCARTAADEGMVPLVDLRAVFGQNDDPNHPDAGVGLCIDVDDQHAVVWADHVAGEAQVVFKSLGPRLQGVRGVAGAAEVPGHGLILVLELHAILTLERA